MHITDDTFEMLLAEAIDHIPKQYREKMQSVAIVVEDAPSSEQRVRLKLRPCQALFGLYEGIPLTKRGGATLSVPPDIITIFRRPMIDLFPQREALKHQIYETLWHEVAHYFGLGHSQIADARKK